MSRNSTALLIVASVVIVGAFVFFNNSKDQSPTGTDLTGAIGTADKYRSEQITPSDVVTSESPTPDIWVEYEAGHMTFEELGNALARVPAQERLNLYSRLTPAMAAKALENAPEAERASVIGRASVEERVSILGRLSVEERASVLGKAGIDAAAYERANVQGRVEMAGRVTGGLGEIYQRATVEERVNMLNRFAVEERYAMFDRGFVGERAGVEQLGRVGIEESKQ